MEQLVSGMEDQQVRENVQTQFMQKEHEEFSETSGRSRTKRQAGAVLRGLLNQRKIQERLGEAVREGHDSDHHGWLELTAPATQATFDAGLPSGSS